MHIKYVIIYCNLTYLYAVGVEGSLQSCESCYLHHIDKFEIGPPTSDSWPRSECVPAGITTASRRRPHLRSGRSCAHSRIYGSTPGGRPLRQYTWDCPAGSFLCRARKKLLREPPSRLRSPAGDTPPGRQGDPMRRRTPCPIQNPNTAPPGPRTGAGHPPVWQFLWKKKYRRQVLVRNKFISVENRGAFILIYGFFLTCRRLCGGAAGGRLLCYSEVTSNQLDPKS